MPIPFATGATQPRRRADCPRVLQFGRVEEAQIIMEKEDPGEKKLSPIAPPTSYIHTTSEHGARRHDALLAASLFFNAQLGWCWSRLVGISGYGCDGSVLRRRLERFRKTDTVLLSQFPFCLSVCLPACPMRTRRRCGSLMSKVSRRIENSLVKLGMFPYGWWSIVPPSSHPLWFRTLVPLYMDDPSRHARC